MCFSVLIIKTLDTNRHQRSHSLLIVYWSNLVNNALKELATDYKN